MFTNISVQGNTTRLQSYYYHYSTQVAHVYNLLQRLQHSILALEIKYDEKGDSITSLKRP